MARVPYFNLDEAEGKLAEYFSDSEFGQLNIAKMVAHVGDAAIPWIELVQELRNNGELDPVIREMAIVRVAWHAKSDYELYYHGQQLLDMDVTQEKIQAVLNGPTSDSLSEFEKDLIRFTDQIVDRFKPNDEAFERMRSTLSMRQLHELVFNIGLYLMSSAYMATFELELEPDAARAWEEVGQASARIQKGGEAE